MVNSPEPNHTASNLSKQWMDADWDSLRAPALVDNQLEGICATLISQYKLAETNETVSARALNELAHSLEPTISFASLNGLDIDKLTSRQFSNLVDELCLRVLVPRNVVVGTVRDATGLVAVIGVVNPNTWRSISVYDNSTVWSADYKTLTGPTDMNGFSTANLALLDPKRASADAITALGVIKTTGYLPNPLILEYLNKVDSLSLTRDQVGIRFGIDRFRSEEIQHAKDHIFVDRLKGDAEFQLLPSERASILLKPDSSLQSYLHSEELSSLRELIGRAICELCGRLGGVITEISNHLSRKRFDLAHALLLDFFVQHYTSHVTHAASTKLAADSPYRLASRFLFSAFHNVGIPSIEALMQVMNKSNKQHPAVATLSLLERVFKADFYTDQERVELMRSSD